ncbi:MAG TPA: branched-chain amino acid ABC transporter permease, partial [Anaerolineales bacterium]|nr:branched-chain amino acid ABC transporter permease [Anaerolineales bacterium]
MDSFLRTVADQTVNGLVIGNIYALTAVGLALIFGVSNLINFAHGSVYLIGAYVGWVAITWLHWPFVVTLVAVALSCAAIGLVIERVGLRDLQGSARIAPLLSTIGLSFAFDQIVQLAFTANPQSFASPLPDTRWQVGGVTIGTLDVLIAAISLGVAAALFAFLRFTRLGWALRATAQDRDAAQQMGVDVNRVQQVTFALASALGGLAGLLVGLYFNTVYPTMSFQAGLKGFAANLLGGLGNVPGTVVGGLVLGLIESYGVAVLSSTYRNLFAFLVLIVVLVWRPRGMFSRERTLPPETLTGTFISN